MAEPVPLEEKPRKQLTLKRKLSLPIDSLVARYKASSGNHGKLPEIHEAINEVQEEENSLSNLDSIAVPLDGYTKSQDDKDCVPLTKQGHAQRKDELLDDFPFLDMSLVDASEMETTCLVALAGLSLGGYSFEQNPDMVSYVKQVFKLQDKQFQLLYQKATQKESCELKLLCRVNSGHALQLKDSKGSQLLNPVCILTILNSRNQRNAIVLNDNVKVWLEKGIIGSIRLTSTKQNASSPIWKETFKLPLQNVSEEMLVVEVWSDDKSVKTSKKFYDKKAKNFIGRSFYLLQTVPVGGEEKTLTLYSHSGKHQRGQIKVQLNILGLEESTPPDVAHRDHKMLFKALVDHDSKIDGKYTRRWNAKLCPEAERLIVEHALLTKLCELRQASVQVSVLVEYHKLYGISFTVLEEITRRIKDNYSLLPVDVQPTPLWIKQLTLNLQEIVSSLIHVMEDHLSYFNLKSSDDLFQIRNIIRAMQTIYSLPEVVQRLSPEKRDLKGALVLSIQASVPRWFFELSKNVIEDGTVSDCSAMELVAIRGLCLHCLRNCSRVQKNLNPIFVEVGIDYYTVFYLELDKLLFGEIISRLELRSKEKDPIMYELYVIFKDMAKLTENMQLSERERKDLRVLNYHLWFSSMAVNWINSALKKGRDKIELAIEKDKPEEVQVENQARFSSSAVDASYFIMQIGTFWKNLEWPVAAEAYGYLCTIIESISELTLYYVDELYKFLLHDSSVMHDENGRFRVHEKLCIGLNNMYHVRKALISMPSSMELEKYYEWLDKEEGIGERAKKLVENLMVSNDEDISNKISYFLDLIAQKLSTDVHHFFDVLIPTSGSYRHRSGTAELALPYFTLAAMHVFHSSKTEKLTNDEIIEPILDYLTANLQTLGDYLLTPVLNGILHQLWGLIIGVMQSKITIIPRKSSSADVCQQLGFVLGELKSFFNCDGNGVPYEDLDTEACKNVELQLKLLQTPTKEVIDMFYIELIKRQASSIMAGDDSLGTLDLIVAYLKDKETVEVTVVQARNLQELSKNGSSDPFVELNFVPDWVFSKSSNTSFKTGPQKQTINPIFSTEFFMPAVSESLSEKSATLLATVYQHDTNELIGLGVVPCKEIPHLLGHVTSLQSTASPERKRVTLPLISIIKTPILSELEARWEIGDSEATDFCRSKRKLLHKMDLRKPNFRWLSNLNS